jgi:6-phosphofructokinase 1
VARPAGGLTKPLDIPAVRGLLPRGGTILGSSRTNPFAVENGVEKIKKNLQDLGVDALIAIGGEDTLGVATKLHEIGVHVVGVPKTIDNDLSGTDYTFGSTPRSPSPPRRSTACTPPRRAITAR